MASTRIKNRRKKSCGFFVFIQNCCTFGTIFACKEHEKEQKHIADINKYLKDLYEAIDEFEKYKK